MTRKERREAAELWGLTEEEARDPPVEVWPDNLATVNAFIAASTQWRVGPAGPIGLDYTALPTVLRFNGAPEADWSDIFNGLRTMEDAALKTMRGRKKHD